ncbi:MAG: peptidyl-prolyl cis-trans isomerase, partial [Alphaproteobacteria bacterium]|nr:peptidyl-prolyl cis-trans isomerase [Alphaproteobacteria bacterium]
FDDALQKSLDEKTKTTGGKIGYLKRMEVAPELFEKILSTPEKGIVSEPLNFGKMGSSVLRVLSTRPITIPAFEEIKAEFKKAMMPELSQDVVKSIKSKAELKLFALDGTQIPERSEEELRKSLESDAPSTVDVDKIDDSFVVARFNGGEITLGEVRKVYAGLPEMLRILPLAKMYELVLIKTANEKVLMTAASKANIENDAKIKEKIAAESLMLVQDAYLKSEAEKLITDTELLSEYERVKKNANEANEMEYRLRHIMVSSEEAAKDILSKIKSGTSFDDLLSESIDDTTKTNNGELGYVRKRFLPKDAQEAISKSVKGTLVNKVIKIDENKYSVMRLEDKRPVTPPSFEQMREKLKAQLIAKKAVEVLEKARKDMDIT